MDQAAGLADPLAAFVAARLDEFERDIDPREDNSGPCDWLEGIHLDMGEAQRWLAAGRAIVSAYTGAATADRYSSGLEPIDHFQDGLKVAMRAVASIWPFHPDYEAALADA